MKDKLLYRIPEVVAILNISRSPQSWRDGIEVVAMDGFTGFKTDLRVRKWLI